MPLSDHEQRLLEQMERALYAEDPKFASALRNRRDRSSSRRARVIAVLVALGGVGALLGGVATGLVVLGVTGFALLLTAAYLMLHGRRSEVSAATPTAPTQVADSGRRGSGFLNRLEQRWDRRAEDDGR